MAENKKKGISSLTAGVIGVTIGAAVGAGALALSDERNRKRVQKKIREYKKKGNEMKGKVEELSTKVGDLIGETKEKIEKNIRSK